MNYLITKGEAGDSRKGICGVMIPDGGFFTVVEYSEESHQQLHNIKQLPGELYTVRKTDLPVGHYAPNGCRVTLASLWDWFLYSKDLEYLDGEPLDGAPVVKKVIETRPPDMTDRPAYVHLDELTEEQREDLPPAVLKAREQLKAAAEKATAAVTPVANTVDSVIPVESDLETLETAGATDKLAMLRAALDARGIEWSHLAKEPSLLRKLQDAEKSEVA